MANITLPWICPDIRADAIYYVVVSTRKDALYLFVVAREDF